MTTESQNQNDFESLAQIEEILLIEQIMAIPYTPMFPDVDSHVPENSIIPHDGVDALPAVAENLDCIGQIQNPTQLDEAYFTPLFDQPGDMIPPCDTGERGKVDLATVFDLADIVQQYALTAEQRNLETLALSEEATAVELHCVAGEQNHLDFAPSFDTSGHLERQVVVDEQYVTDFVSVTDQLDCAHLHGTVVEDDNLELIPSPDDDLLDLIGTVNPAYVSETKLPQPHVQNIAHCGGPDLEDFLYELSN